MNIKLIGIIILIVIGGGVGYTLFPSHTSESLIQPVGQSTSSAQPSPSLQATPTATPSIDSLTPEDFSEDYTKLKQSANKL